MKRLITFILLFSLDMAIADTSPSFSFQAELSQGQQSLRQFEIPFTVYEKLAQGRHNDLRVFDTNGIEVPSSVSFPYEQINQQKTTQRVKFFIKPELEKSAFNRRTGNEVALRSILFIENPNTEQPLTQFELDWENAQRSTTLSVQVKTSSDMSNWESIATSDFLYDLHHLGEKLQNKIIKLKQPSTARYLAIQFTGSENGLAPKITKIKATNQKQLNTTPAVYQQKIDTVEFDSESNAIQFRLPKSLKIESLEIATPNSTGLYKGRFYSGYQRSTTLSKRQKLKQRLKNKIKQRDNDKSASSSLVWQYDGTFIQYKLITEAGTLTSDATTMRTNNQHTFWKAEFSQPKQLSNKNLPNISYTWRPATLTFLAQGEASFSIRFASNSSLSSRPSLAGLGNISKPEVVTIKNITAISSPEANAAEATPPPQNYQWLLWIVLGLGLLLMAFIGYRVSASFKKTESV